VRETISLLQKTFRIRQCEDSYFRNRSRPCLQYQIKRCTAPCVNLISEQAYRQDIKHTLLFLEGKSSQIVEELVAAMEKAAESEGGAGPGMGMGMGLMMPAMFSQYFAGGKQGTPQGGAPETTTCAECQNPIPLDAKFCPKCGHQQLVFNQCANCGKNLTPSAKFCSRCGHAAEEKPASKFCSKCGKENMPESMYCNKCGEKL